MQSVRSEYQAALAQENSLMAALNQQKAEALSMNRKAIDYGVLARDVESSKQLYNNLLQRAKETGVTGELRTSNIRVVDAAEKPRSPVSPNRARTSCSRSSSDARAPAAWSSSSSTSTAASSLPRRFAGTSA